MATTETPAAVQVLPAVKPKRRKWGWIFFALFVVQAFVFGGIIGKLYTDAASDRSFARHMRTSPTKDCDTYCQMSSSQSSSMMARGKQSSANALLVVAVVTSIVTLVLGFIGTRRRKEPVPAA